jgi:acetolactate synthase-1/2/3 large subunit
MPKRPAKKPSKKATPKSAKRPAERNGGRLVVDALRQHGVDTVFCVPGESYLEVLDGLYDVGNEIRVVTCRHENGAAVMAEAQGKLTGRPGVCMVTRGPGACNASIGIHTAFQDQTPMVMLVGQVPNRFRGREAFQEVEVREMFKPLAKDVIQIDRAEDVPQAIAEAFCNAMSDRPGPIVVVLPEDMQREVSKVDDVPPLPVPLPELNKMKLDRLFAILATMAEQPMVILGGGGWTEKAKRDILTFVERNELPVCTGFRRMDLIDNNHPCFVGDLGLAPLPGLVERVTHADVVLCIGTRLGEITSQSYTIFDDAPEYQVRIHVHPSDIELGRIYPMALEILSDLTDFAAEVASRSKVGDGSWSGWTKAARKAYLDNLKPPPVDGDIDLGKIATWLAGRLPPDAIISLDAGNYAGWIQRFVPVGGKRRLLGPCNGAMGYGVPGAVAAKIREPNRMVLGCCGDGGFGMTGQEIATAVAQGAAPIILVFNNGIYGTIRMHQEREHPGRVVGTGLVNPDYAALARAHGAHGETVTKTKDFAPAFERAVKSGKAAVIELHTDPDVITPRTTLTEIRKQSLKRAKG